MCFETEYEKFRKRLSVVGEIRGSFVELSKISGLDRTTFSKINNGGGNPTINVLIAIDKAIDEFQAARNPPSGNVVDQAA